MKPIELKSKKTILSVICIFLIFAVVSAFVYTGRTYGNQSKNAMYPSAQFCGQYKLAQGSWQPYVKGKHIPSDKGDVTLKGYFELVSPENGESFGKASEGTTLALYLNHIGGTITEDGGDPHYLDAELGIAGEDMCGKMYIGYTHRGGQEVTITLSNPHKFGNPLAIDEFLNNLSVYGGTDFERDILNRGSIQRNFGIILILAAFMVLGTAILSMLIHMMDSRNLWLIGLGLFFAGLYIMFTSHGIAFFSEIIKFNTRVHGASMMLYMLTATAFLTHCLSGKAKNIAKLLAVLCGISTFGALTAPMISSIKFFDTIPIWTAVQGLACIVMTCLLAYSFSCSEKKNEMLYAFGMLPMMAFLFDALATAAGWWQGGFISIIVFLVLALTALILIIKRIPQSIHATVRAKELETEKKILKAELAESRIATMISQIQPHFIYNTLGTIEQLCLTEPESASKLVHDFSLYLRGNFSELDNAKPIRFSQEMNHVKHYTNIEQVRFPDMTIQYDLRSVEFVLPALSVQPIVENAIKHGLMGLEKGGIVKISAYETDTHYVVEVTDDGVGFDSSKGYDEKKHVGLKNIRGRIEAMCNGTLSIESTPGKGTKATIKIPKETNKNDSNNS